MKFHEAAFGLFPLDLHRLPEPQGQAANAPKEEGVDIPSAVDVQEPPTIGRRGNGAGKKPPSRGRTVRMRLARSLARLALAGILLALLWRYFSGLDFSLVGLRIGESGVALLLVLVPYSLIFLAESIAWRLSIRRRPGPGLGSLYLIRVATDAILYSVPGGVALAEPLRPVLLRRRCGVELTEGIGSCIITKITIAVAQVFFIFVGFILVMVFYPGVGLQLGIEGGVAGYLLGGFTLLCAIGLLTLPFSGPRLTQLLRLLARVPLAPFRNAVARLEPAVNRLDVHVGRFARDHTSRFVGSLLAAFVAWLLIAVETYLILRILGAEPTFTQAVALESVASILRIVFFFLPGGLGASEVGFVSLLVAFGFPQALPLAGAYIIVKRLKEVGWVVVGYCALWFLGFNPFRKTKANNAITSTQGVGQCSKIAITRENDSSVIPEPYAY